MRRDLGAIAVCVGAVVCYATLQASCFVPQWTDENVHLYVAERIASGAVPYAEVPSARPPLALALPVLLLALGLAPLMAARVGVSLLTLATAVAVLLGARRLWGPLAGVAAFALLLLTRDRVAYTGIDAVELGVTVAAPLTVLRRPWAAGAAGGLAPAPTPREVRGGRRADAWQLPSEC